MKLRSVKLRKIEEKPKTRKSNKGNTLPKDTYEPMFPPMRFLVRETRSYKDNSVIRQYIEISVKRINDDNLDEAFPYVWIQMYQESDFYTGYLKGKTVYLPLEMLYELIDSLTDVSAECDRLGITQ